MCGDRGVTLTEGRKGKGVTGEGVLTLEREREGGRARESSVCD